jgi:hypothetical protein
VVLVGLWSATRIQDEIIDHDVFWLSGIGVLGLATLLNALWSDRRRVDWQRLRVVPLVSVASCCIVAGLGVQQLHLRARTPARLEQLAATKFGEALIAHIRATGHKPLITIDQNAWPVAAGLVATLAKAGCRFAVENDWLPMFLESVGATGHEDEIVAVVERRRFAGLAAGDASTIAAEEPYYMLLGNAVGGR